MSHGSHADFLPCFFPKGFFFWEIFSGLCSYSIFCKLSLSSVLVYLPHVSMYLYLFKLVLGRNSQNKPNDFGFMLYCTVEPICIIHHYLFKIFCCFWLAPIPRLILYDQMVLTTFGRLTWAIYYLEGCWRPWWKTFSLICIILQIPLSLIQYLLNIKPNLTILGMANDTCNNPLSPSIQGLS